MRHHASAVAPATLVASATLVTLVTLAGSGCAARFDGELDGKPVPTFASAAFGSSSTRSTFGFGNAVHIVMAMLAPGDSCVDGADLLKAERRLGAAVDDQQRQDRAEAVADLMNERFPEDSWYGRLIITAPDDDDLDDVEVDVSDQAAVALQQFLLCQRSGDVNAVNGAVQTDDDCYFARDGDIDVTRSEDQTTLSLVSERGVEFIDEGGREEGELGFTLNFGECEDLDDEVDARFPPT
jgi:hypothetical protein